MIEHRVDKQDNDRRLDRVLGAIAPRMLRSEMFKLLRMGKIRVNGKKAEASDHVMEGDVVVVRIGGERGAKITGKAAPPTAERAGIAVVFENEEMLVVDKPAGMLTHPAGQEYASALSSRVQFYLRDLCSKTFAPAPVQRLDRNTSGCVLFAKTPEALSRLTAQMREHTIRKKYLCIVHGVMRQRGEVRGFLAKDDQSNRAQISHRKDAMHPLEVDTRFSPLESSNGYTLVDVELRTGRSHQIRASLAFAGFPIIGDTKYGGREVAGMTTQALHAWELEIDGIVIQRRNEFIDGVWGRIVRGES